ncbi:MAG: hypothetical protein IH936_15790, partial [Acidobacteria bacterium]|nr:hypothetical protein [Acidobacteriota bacterium]
MRWNIAPIVLALAGGACSGAVETGSGEASSAAPNLASARIVDLSYSYD